LAQKMLVFERPMFSPNTSFGGLSIIEGHAEGQQFMVTVPLNKRIIQDIRAVLSVIESSEFFDLL